MELDLTKFSKHSNVSLLFFVFTLIVPSYYFLFEFRGPLIKDLDNFRLILLCISISFPVVLFNVNLLLFFVSNGAPMVQMIEQLLIVGSLITNFTLYFPCILLFFFDLNFKMALIICILFNLIFGLICVTALNEKGKSQLQ